MTLSQEAPLSIHKRRYFCEPISYSNPLANAIRLYKTMYTNLDRLRTILEQAGFKPKTAKSSCNL